MSKGGSLDLRLPRHRWERLRLHILNRDGWRCTKCRKASRLEVHHKVSLEHGGDLSAADIVGRAKAFATLKETGMDVDEARRLAGLV